MDYWQLYWWTTNQKCTYLRGTTLLLGYPFRLTSTPISPVTTFWCMWEEFLNVTFLEDGVSSFSRTGASYTEVLEPWTIISPFLPPSALGNHFFFYIPVCSMVIFSNYRWECSVLVLHNLLYAMQHNIPPAQMSSQNHKYILLRCPRLCAFMCHTFWYFFLKSNFLYIFFHWHIPNFTHILQPRILCSTLGWFLRY